MLEILQRQGIPVLTGISLSSIHSVGSRAKVHFTYMQGNKPIEGLYRNDGKAYFLNADLIIKKTRLGLPSRNLKALTYDSEEELEVDVMETLKVNRNFEATL